MAVVFQRTAARMAQLIPRKADPQQYVQTRRTNMCGVARSSVDVTQGGRYFGFFACVSECCSCAKGRGCRADDAIHQYFDIDRRAGWRKPPAAAALDNRAFDSAAALIDCPDMDGQTSEETAAACSKGHATVAACAEPPLVALDGQPPGPTEVAAVDAGLALDMYGQVPGRTLAAACVEGRSTDVLGLPAHHGADGAVDTSEG